MGQPWLIPPLGGDMIRLASRLDPDMIGLLHVRSWVGVLPCRSG